MIEIVKVDSDFIFTIRSVSPDIGLVGSLLQHHVVSIDGGRETGETV